MSINHNVLLDADGVILDSHAFFLDAVNHEYALLIAERVGRPLTYEDIDRWDFGFLREVLGIPLVRKNGDDPLGAVDYFHLAYKQKKHIIGLVDPSCAIVVNYLLQNFETDIVTSNNESEGLRKALSMHGIETERFRQDGKGDTSEYGVLIEDNPTISFGEHQVLLLRDRPWNRGLNGSNVLRFDDSCYLPGLVRAIAQFGSLQTIEQAVISGSFNMAGAESNIEFYGFRLLEKVYS